MAPPYPGPIGAPATRALTRAGILSWSELSEWAESDLAALHGVGPKAIRLLGESLAEQNKSFVEASSAEGRAEVDAFLAALPDPQRTTLQTVRECLLELLPAAGERLSYSMPAVTVAGTAVAGYDAFVNHCGYFAHSGTVVEAAGDALDGYEGSKSGIHFPHDQPLPKKILKLLVGLKLGELSAVQSGTRIETFSDGRVKAIGRMKKGELDGQWKWFRKDGSLMRSGSFRNGEQARTWTTYTPDGEVAKTTEY